MNGDDAIRDHIKIKMKLRIYIAKPDGTLDPEAIAVDNGCELGRWLHGEGMAFAGTGEYQALIVEHARLHKAAADIIARANRGERLTEEAALGPRSEFSGLLSRMVAQILSLQFKTRAQG
jgi:hypothetical protein